MMKLKSSTVPPGNEIGLGAPRDEVGDVGIGLGLNSPGTSPLEALVTRFNLKQTPGQAHEGV
jgi:hypothetical protein